MSVQTINLAELDSQPKEIRAAIAFYAAHSVLPITFSVEERSRHYAVLESAGYIEKM